MSSLAPPPCSELQRVASGSAPRLADRIKTSPSVPLSVGLSNAGQATSVHAVRPMPPSSGQCQPGHLCSCSQTISVLALRPGHLCSCIQAISVHAARPGHLCSCSQARPSCPAACSQARPVPPSSVHAVLKMPAVVRAYFPLRLPQASDVVYVPIHLRGDEGTLWELRQFHHRLSSRPLSKWLKEELSKAHAVPKQEYSTSAVASLCPGVPVSVVMSRKAALS